MVIPVQDSEYEDILIHLPDACQFIETALGCGGKVLVHCVMGISRSATIVCAYRECPLLCPYATYPRRRPCAKSWYLSGFLSQQQCNTSANVSPCEPSPTNLVHVYPNSLTGRPEIHPNYGFVKQLHAFVQCRYKPSCSNGEYIAWKRRQKREATKYLNLLTDCIPVIPDQLYLTRFVCQTSQLQKRLTAFLSANFLEIQTLPNPFC